jgi:hypothetical protein
MMPKKTPSAPALRRILAAGVLGGCAEAAWVAVYCGPAAAAEVARQVAESIVGGAGASAHALAWGVAIHMLLSVLLALAYAMFVWQPVVRRLGMAAQLAISGAVLAAVWAVNFLVVLPAVNPAFVELMPYSVTLASKLMFGMAMAAGLGFGSRERAASRERARPLQLALQ